MQVSEIIALPYHAEKRNVVYWQNLPIEKLPECSELLIFLQFSEVVALPVQDMLPTEILMCDGNAKIDFLKLNFHRK